MSRHTAECVPRGPACRAQHICHLPTCDHLAFQVKGHQLPEFFSSLASGNFLGGQEWVVRFCVPISRVWYLILLRIPLCGLNSGRRLGKSPETLRSLGVQGAARWVLLQEQERREQQWRGRAGEQVSLLMSPIQA